MEVILILILLIDSLLQLMSSTEAVGRRRAVLSLIGAIIERW